MPPNQQYTSMQSQVSGVFFFFLSHLTQGCIKHDTIDHRPFLKSVLYFACGLSWSCLQLSPPCLAWIINIVFFCAIPQGYTTYGSHMGMQQHPSQSGSIVPHSYGNQNFPGAHPGANPTVVDPVRQQRPSGYLLQQAPQPTGYPQSMQNTQRSVLCCK